MIIYLRFVFSFSNTGARKSAARQLRDIAEVALTGKSIIARAKNGTGPASVSICLFWSGFFNRSVGGGPWFVSYLLGLYGAEVLKDDKQLESSMDYVRIELKRR